MVKLVTLSRNMTAKVDDADYETLTQRRWYAHVCGTQGYIYAVCTYKTKKVYMHRMIMNAAKGEVIDHINGDRLDNRRANLRVCTHAQNLRNSTRSVYGGTWFDKQTGRWVARTQWDGTRIMLGRFQSREDASRAVHLARSLLATGADPKSVPLRISARHEAVSNVPSTGNGEGSSPVTVSGEGPAGG